MKIYIAFIDEGSWDNWVKYVDKVFSTKEAAEEYSSKINKEMADKKALFPKGNIDFKSDPNKSEEENKTEFDRLKDELDNFIKNHRDDPFEILEFNKCIVEEFEVL